MTRIKQWFVALFASALIANAAEVTLAIRPCIGVTNISLTRVSYLVSEFSFQNSSGGWLSLPNVVWFDLEKNRDRATLELPEGSYEKVRFRIGLNSELNHSDPAIYALDHPLNPNLDGLHWNWRGGYVFMALEGMWNGTNGFSYHLAGDDLKIQVELPIQLRAPGSLSLILNFDRVFPEFTEATSTTHSRSGDPLAVEIGNKLSKALEISPQPLPPAETKRNTPNTLIARNATPYRFRMSKFFPQPNLPRDNPLTEEGVALGKRLFNEPLLSLNGSQTCASCHQAANAFSEPKRFSVGVDGKEGTRNAMPLMNLAWKESFFWDGRAATLRQQVLQPVENPIEMHESVSNVVRKLSNSQEYPARFEKAFGPGAVTFHKLARALEQFLLAQVSFNSKFDRALAGEAELTDEEKRGFELFNTEYDPRHGQFGADCFHCHGGALFQSQTFANNGVDAAFIDKGRAAVSGKDSDLGKFAVPSLRNVAVTAPYMHDGRFASIDEVIEHYATGVKRSSTLDPNLAKHPDGGVPLTAADKKALVAFLKTLTDEAFIDRTNLARVRPILAEPILARRR